MNKEAIDWNDFQKVEMRIGTIVQVDDFPEAKKPAYQLKVDLGEIGIKNSSAQICDLYEKEDLKGRQVVVVSNFPPKKIADYSSECLVLGVIGLDEGVVLLKTEQSLENGSVVR